DGAVINVRATDDKIRERDGFLEILAPPRKPKLGFDTYAGWLGYVLPNDALLVKRFPAYPDRVYHEAAGLTLSLWHPPGRRSALQDRVAVGGRPAVRALRAGRPGVGHAPRAAPLHPPETRSGAVPTRKATRENRPAGTDCACEGSAMGTEPPMPFRTRLLLAF